ncbi:MAG: CPBP family intramembrane metalloprotease [Bacteroides oleiciplenus]|nr:CPBP family intramembrane metalloprotease [Bacteroides oleiciplenus]
MESMNENAGAVRQEPKVVVYLTVAAKIIVYVLLILGFAAAFAFLAGDLLKWVPALAQNGTLSLIVQEGCFLAGVFLAAFILLKWWDCLPFSDLGLSVKGRWKDFLWGTLAAFALYVIGFGVLYLSGEIKITGVQFDGTNLLLMWIFMLLVAVTEETALRGFVLGRLLNAGVNRFVALFISAALFSLLHIFNPNFSLIAFLNILLAGLMLGASYIYTRNLWFPIALHLFWNWLQGPVLGFEVSGGQFGNTLLSLELPEKNIINGGAFGFEGSVVCTALMIIMTVIILKSASRQSSCDPCPHLAPEPGHAGE